MLTNKNELSSAKLSSSIAVKCCQWTVMGENGEMLTRDIQLSGLVLWQSSQRLRVTDYVCLTCKVCVSESDRKCALTRKVI